MTIRRHAILAAAAVVVSALVVARAPAREPARASGESAVRAALSSAVMCVAEPEDPPPCALPDPAAR